jgi:hypothetical protein
MVAPCSAIAWAIICATQAAPDRQALVMRAISGTRGLQVGVEWL